MLGQTHYEQPALDPGPDGHADLLASAHPLQHITGAAGVNVTGPPTEETAELKKGKTGKVVGVAIESDKPQQALTGQLRSGIPESQVSGIRARPGCGSGVAADVAVAVAWAGERDPGRGVCAGDGHPRQEGREGEEEAGARGRVRVRLPGATCLIWPRARPGKEEAVAEWLCVRVWVMAEQEVERKKKALDRLEIALADMEATRVRKDRCVSDDDGRKKHRGMQ